ncbi:MAG: SprT family zinc-dependent metalloprotease [Flavobacterium sp.]|jgi:predicted metal-dependent hydrolase|uniref:M48 family metallopeptidase n=1 Tax=Flavobacterium sp. TaxID=239 RepID=UPI0022CA81B6|nr:SprT family zinc-dependent metalloprotease [Flavobacterium sp.]MCZ8330666.1 SprT family zinc-dependent metalloprotease [Flavobacterium sp.]
MHHIQYGTKQIAFSVAEKKRKSIAVEVHPDTSVQIKAPLDCSIDTIKKVVSKRSRWIITQQKFFEQFLPESPKREYVIGETHKYLGRNYILKIIISQENKVKIQGSYLVVFTTKSDTEVVRHLMTEWYYKRASKLFIKVYDEAFKKFRHYNFQKPELQIKRMKKRWGSYTSSNKIVINPELIKASSACIEYVFIHELCHLIERNHSKKFYNLLEQIAPDWKHWKLKLEKM